MKNKVLVLLLGFMMVLSLGFSFAGKAYAEACPIDVKCITCQHHKVDCCKHCCCNNCKDCKDCKQCCNTDKQIDPAKHDCCKKEKPAE